MTTRRVVQIPIYWLAVGLACLVVSPILSIVASVKIAQGNQVRAQAAATLAQAKAREEQRLRTCDLFSGLLDTYIETPPTTLAGRNVQRTYVEFYNKNHCQPPRVK